MEANTFLSRVFFLVLEKNGTVLGDGYGETFPNEPNQTKNQLRLRSASDAMPLRQSCGYPVLAKWWAVDVLLGEAPNSRVVR